VIALVTTGLASAASDTHAESLTIRLIATPTGSRAVDVPPKGQLNKGDAIYGQTVLRNAVAQFGRPKGAIVGRDSEVGTFLSPQMLLVTAVVRIPGGTLRLKGKQAVNDLTFTLPVVGGSGRFENARGTCAVRPQGGLLLNVYRLRLT
jgi:Dirigent-like protein